MLLHTLGLGEAAGKGGPDQEGEAPAFGAQKRPEHPPRLVLPRALPSYHHQAPGSAREFREAVRSRVSLIAHPAFGKWKMHPAHATKWSRSSMQVAGLELAAKVPLAAGSPTGDRR